MMQQAIVIIILILAVVYAAWRIYRALTNDNEACEGCALAENCMKKKKSRRKILRCREK
jgi:hypothetical protein